MRRSSAWFAARRGVPDVDPAGVLPTIGSKELVAWLPILLGLGAGDVVAFPRVAYPTYDVGARLAGATPLALDALTSLGPPTKATTPKLLWLNTPGNPTGKVLGVEHLAKVVAWAREHGVVVASDECYAELDWRAREAGSTEPPTTTSILDPRVTGGSHEGLLCVYSPVEAVQPRRLPRRVRRRRPGARRTAPRGAQARRDDGALAGAAGRARRALGRRATSRSRRRGMPRAAPRCSRRSSAFGLRVDDSEAGLYLWATAGEDGRVTIERLADRGILAAPGDFYGPAGREHVRLALTATDERVAAAVRRLA